MLSSYSFKNVHPFVKYANYEALHYAVFPSPYLTRPSEMNTFLWDSD